MSRWIHIASFTFPDDAGLVVTYLESEDVKCVTQNNSGIERYAEIAPTASGIKLLIQYDNYDKAVDLLEEGGFEKFLIPINEEYPFVEWFRKATNQFGFFSKKPLSFRLFAVIISVAFLLGLILFGLYWLTSLK